MGKVGVKPVAATVVIALAGLGLNGYGRFHADSVLTGSVRQALSDGGPLTIRVHMDFKPEPFNRMYLAQFGNPGATSGNTVMVFNVSPSGVEQIARQYWVKSIELR